MTKTFDAWSREYGSWSLKDPSVAPDIKLLQFAVLARIATALERLCEVLDPTTLDARMSAAADQKEKAARVREQNAVGEAAFTLHRERSRLYDAAFNRAMGRWNDMAGASLSGDARERLSRQLAPEGWWGDPWTRPPVPPAIDTLPAFPDLPPERLGEDRWKYQQRYATWRSALVEGAIKRAAAAL